MKCVFLAERAILLELDALSVVFLVLDCAVISLLAVRACHSNLDSHIHTSSGSIVLIRFSAAFFAHKKTANEKNRLYILSLRHFIVKNFITVENGSARVSKKHSPPSNGSCAM